MKKITYVTDRDFEEIIVEADGWVVVWFFSRGSIPCDHFETEFEAYAKQAGDSVRCLRMDVDENPSITEELLVEAVPTTLVFREGEELARFEGPYSREALIDRIGTIIKGGEKK